MQKNNPPPYSEVDNTTYPHLGFHPPKSQQQPQLQSQSQPQPQPQPLQAVALIPVRIVATVFGPESQVITCPYCHNHIATRVQPEAGIKTHVAAAFLCFLGGLICCIIPYCMDSCKDRCHYCPICQSYLGAYTF